MVRKSVQFVVEDYYSRINNNKDMVESKNKFLLDNDEQRK